MDSGPDRPRSSAARSTGARAGSRTAGHREGRGPRPQLLLAVAIVALLAAGGLAALLADEGTASSSDGVALSAVATPVAPAAPITAPQLATPATPTAAAVAASPAPATPPPATATAAPAPLASSPPAAATVPAPPTIELRLRPEQVGTGETLLVTVEAPASLAATGGTLDILGGRYTLQRAEGLFWGLVGVPLDTAIGAATLSVRLRDVAGATVAVTETTFEVQAIERPVDYLTLTSEQAAVLTAEAGARELELRGQQFTEFDGGRRWTGLFLVPVAGMVTAEFGQGRSYNGGPVGGFHTGRDLAAAAGTPVRAAAAGRVAWVGEMPIRGSSVLLDHGGGVKTGYHHLQVALVTVGDVLTGGESLGLLGATGLATGPHLHWELTVWGVNVDPITWTRYDFTP